MYFLIIFMTYLKIFAFTDDNTRSKFLFFGGPECLHMRDSLEQCVSAEFIPDFLGGPCEVSAYCTPFT